MGEGRAPCIFHTAMASKLDSHRAKGIPSALFLSQSWLIFLLELQGMHLMCFKIIHKILMLKLSKVQS